MTESLAPHSSSYRTSQYFLPIKQDLSSDITLASHKLMVRSGMIKQISSGLYAWLPLGLRVLQKVSDIIRDELNKAGFCECLMPTMQPQELWNESGRGTYCGEETLIVKDRHGKSLIYGPTAEEMLTFTVRNDIQSYKNLPLTMYNIQWKFRDEIRPRFGVMRAREFLMMDSYSFDNSPEDAVKTYNAHYDAYLRIFARMGLVALPMQADTGEIGGDMSHEFLVLAESGESEVIYDADLDAIIDDIKNGRNHQNMREKISQYYAVTSEKHDSSISRKNLKTTRGIEVGHNFYFDTKYSKAMNLSIQDASGKTFHPFMGSYGIGVGRLVAAMIESSHDEHGIIWNKNVSPFSVHLLNISTKDENSVKYADEIYAKLQSMGISVLYDDSDAPSKKKFDNADLIGIPKQIIVSQKLCTSQSLEIKDRASGERTVLPFDEMLSAL